MDRKILRIKRKSDILSLWPFIFTFGFQNQVRLDIKLILNLMYWENGKNQNPRDQILYSVTSFYLVI